MINIWATWCDPCKNELSELEKYNQELAERGCHIIGICQDALDDEIAADAIKILEERGVTYPNVRATDDIIEMLPTMSMPTTYFVDENGKVLVGPVRGADFDRYRERIEEALSALE